MNDNAPSDGSAAAAAGRVRSAAIEPAALEAAIGLVRTLASPDAAALFHTFVELHLDQACAEASEEGLGAFLAGLPPDPATAAERIRLADSAFSDAFGTRLVFEEEGEGLRRLRFAAGPADLIDRARVGGEAAPAIGAASVVLRDAARTWIAVVAAATASGRGHHLGLRADGRGSRALDDFAEGLKEAGLDVIRIDVSRRPALALLSCELRGGARPAVVVASGEVLVADPSWYESENGDDEGSDEAMLALGQSATSLLPALGGLRNTYVWRMPARGKPPHELAAFIGGLIEGVEPDPSWSVSHLIGERPWLDEAGARRLLAAAGDPRDAAAMAALAEAASTTPGFDSPEAACRFVAAPFTGSSLDAAHLSGTEPARTGQFDPRLLVCDDDGLALLRRGEALSQGCRVLAVGPPSGGKTTYAAALAESVARASGRTILRVEPADLLAKAWGATERKVAETFQRARREHLVLVTDEVDSLCTRREADAPASGNAYLIRCLTNEFLRQLDNHPDVPLLATANDEEACDRAFLRRVTMVVRIGDALSAEQERLAWESLLRTAPPSGWEPCGAAVGDFASALARCRLLGRDDAASLSEAVLAARRTRLGRDAGDATRRRGPLH